MLLMKMTMVSIIMKFIIIIVTVLVWARDGNPLKPNLESHSDHHSNPR